MTGENIHYLKTHIMLTQPPHHMIFTVLCKYVSYFKINAYNMVWYLGIMLQFFIWSLVYSRLHDLNRLQNTRGLLNRCKPCQLLQCPGLFVVPGCHFEYSSYVISASQHLQSSTSTVNVAIVWGEAKLMSMNKLI